MSNIKVLEKKKKLLEERRRKKELEIKAIHKQILEKKTKKSIFKLGKICAGTDPIHLIELIDQKRYKEVTTQINKNIHNHIINL